MNWRSAPLRGLAPAAVAILALAGAADAVAPAGAKAYVVNYQADSVSVVALAPFGATATRTIAVGDGPQGAAISPLGDRVYVANAGEPMSITVIDTATDTVVGAPIDVTQTTQLLGLAVSADGSTVYATCGNAVCVVSAASGAQTATIALGTTTWNVVVHPSGSRIYVVTSAIVPVPTATHTPGAPIAAAGGARDAVLFAGGTRLFVVGGGAPTVIDTTTDTVVPGALADLGSQSDVAIGGTLAVVANAYNTTLGAGSVDVYDLGANPPALAGSFRVGGQATGVEIAPDGSVAWAHCVNAGGHGGSGAPPNVLVQFDPRNTSAAGTAADVGAGGDGPGPVVGLFPGGAPPPAAPIGAFIRPASVSVRSNAAAPAKSSVTVAGLLDTGPDAPDFSGPATLDVGGLHEDVPAWAPRGRTLTHVANGFAVSITPNASGSSGARFSLKYTGDLAGKVPTDGALALRFANAAADAGADVTLAAGRFKLADGTGALTDPGLFIAAAKASIRGGGKDTLALTLGFASDGTAPIAASDVTIGFGGTFSVTIPKSSFRRTGAKDAFSGDANGIRKVTVDHSHGTIAISGRALDLGTFAPGGNPVVVTLGLGGRTSAVAVRMGLTGTALKY